VLYAEGCKITTGKQGWSGWYEDNTQLAAPESQAASIALPWRPLARPTWRSWWSGETESTNREAWSETHLGDRDSFELSRRAERSRQGGRGNRRPDHRIPDQRATAIHQLRRGTCAGNFGGVVSGARGWHGRRASPVRGRESRGKLPITFPRSVGQLPDYYDYKPSRNRSYIFTSSEPLFHFGDGLSYTTFKFENLRVEPKQILPGGSATVRVDVTNTGKREGDEIPQLYVHQQIASVTRPVKQLAGFQRIHLKPGEKTTVEFQVTPAALSLINIDMHQVVEPGLFDLIGGASGSAKTRPVTLEVKAK